MMKAIYLFSALLALLSCKKQNTENSSVSAGSEGIFIVNEGNYTWSNSSLSYLNKVTEEFFPDVFTQVNSIPLGDVAFSMTVHKDRGYVVVNNSGLIYIINIKDMSYAGKITNLVSPRYLRIINDSTAYVTDLYDKRISVVNLYSATVTGHISCNRTTENILYLNGLVFVTSWSYGNSLLVINPQSETLTDSVTIGKQPNSMVYDKNGNLWVLCDGGFQGSSYGQEPASLWNINPGDLTVIKTFIFSEIQDSPIHLCINKSADTLYFINRHIYKMSIEAQDLPVTPFIQAGVRNFYSMAVDYSDNKIIATDAKNYMANGEVLIYTNNGQLSGSYTTGINPGNIVITGE